MSSLRSSPNYKNSKYSEFNLQKKIQEINPKLALAQIMNPGSDKSIILQKKKWAEFHKAIMLATHYP